MNTPHIDAVVALNLAETAQALGLRVVVEGEYVCVKDGPRCFPQLSLREVEVFLNGFKYGTEKRA